MVSDKNQIDVYPSGLVKKRKQDAKRWKKPSKQKAYTRRGKLIAL